MHVKKCSAVTVLFLLVAFNSPAGPKKPAADVVTALCSHMTKCAPPNVPSDCRTMLYYGNDCQSSGVQLWDNMGLDDYENELDGELVDKYVQEGKIKVFSKRLEWCLAGIAALKCSDMDAKLDPTMMNIEDLIGIGETAVCSTVLKPLVPLKDEKKPCPDAGSDSGGGSGFGFPSGDSGG